MAMTEKELEELVAEVGEIDWSDPVVLAWLRANLEQNRTIEKQAQARFYVAKMLREDQQMKAAKEQLDNTRRIIATLEECLEEAEG